MEFWVKFSNKTEERISSVIARIKNYIKNDICNNMKNVKLHVITYYINELILLRYSWEKILLCAGWFEGATSGLVEASRASVNNKTCNHQQNRWSF